MTTSIKINSNDGVTPTTATGGETTIDFDFPIYDADHLQIFETDTAGVLTELVKDTHYSVPSGSVEQQAGGTVNLLVGQYPSGATAGHKFTARLNVPEARSTDFQPRGDFLAETLNRELDLITQQIQQLRRDVDASATFRQDIVGKTPVLPEPAANQLIAFEGTDGTMKTVTLVDLASTIDTLLSSISNNHFLVYETAGAAFVNKTITQVQALLGVTTNNYIATADPTVNDDEADGYSVGSRWINNTSGDTFFCKDATLGAAVWETDSLSLGDLGGVVTKDFTTDFTSPDNTTVPGTLSTKNYVDGKFPRLHVQHTESQSVDGGTVSAGDNTRKINTLIENGITDAGIVYDLDFDAQTANFTPGQIVTGGTSGATGTLVAQTDNGTDGTLKLIDITGTFQDNETITDPLGGNATVNDASGQVLANQVWLPANDYRINAKGAAYYVDQHQLFVYDVTNSTELARGMSAFSIDSSPSSANVSHLSNKFTLSTDALVEVRHYCKRTRATNGAGVSSTSGIEVYMDAIFEVIN